MLRILQRARYLGKTILEAKKVYEDKLLKIGENSKYPLIGIPLYNNEDENNF
jgi:hypothetical protein